MKETNKTDWMNDLLAEHDYFVSDHITFSEKLGLPAEYQASLRFFGNVRMGYRYILVIKFNDNENQPTFNNDIFDLRINEFKRIFGGLSALNQNFSVLFYSNTGSYFIYFNSKLEYCDSARLSKYFGYIDPSLTSNLGASKKINVSINDNFQYWTRENLSKFITFNDFDAFKLFSDGKLNILELKRPDKSLIENWFPRTNDIANYKACLRISEDSEYIDFCTVAYNSHDQGKLLSVYISNINYQNQITGTRVLGKVTNFNFDSMRFDGQILSSEQFTV